MSDRDQERARPAPIEWLAAPGPLGFSRGAWLIAAIVLAAGCLRLFQLGRLCFWYDEVVTMRLARSAGPRALCTRLFQIDATRAPLHPLVLQQWVRVFGASEGAARALSVACGIGTIVLVYAIGQIAFDRATGLWAAWLAALSPLLVVYDREARMYAWLVMFTCLAWYLLLSLRRRFSAMRAVLYVLALAALGYSHPLGLLMLFTVAVAALVGIRGSLRAGKRWLILHAAAVLLVLPWIGNYLDHPPEFVSGRLPLRFLLGTPIGFIGGNSWLLLGLAGLIVFGIVRQVHEAHSVGEEGLARDRSMALAFLLLWLIVPPTLLYLYSWLAHPLFGPARYTVFVAPAFLLLVAAGLSKAPAVARYPLAAILPVISALALYPAAFDPNLKADWRGFSSELARRGCRSRASDCRHRGLDRHAQQCRGRDGAVLSAGHLRGHRRRRGHGRGPRPPGRPCGLLHDRLAAGAAKRAAAAASRNLRFPRGRALPRFDRLSSLALVTLSIAPAGHRRAP